MNESYDRLESKQATTKRIVDHSTQWAKLEPVESVNGTVRERIERFCDDKQITLEALEALGTRIWSHGRGPELRLAWGYTVERDGRQAITALKWRNIATGERGAVEPSTFLEPLVIGNRDSLDWFIAEGETDSARLYDLVGDVAAVLVLPAGATAFKREWAHRIPRGATVHLCHDADEPGDEGAAKAAGLLGGRTVRVRPPDGHKDFCSWDGSRDDFIALTAAARSAGRSYRFVSLPDFLARKFPAADPLLGERGQVYLATGSLMLVYGADGSAKSTWTVDGIAHLAAGHDWLGLPVPRPVRFAVVENEGPPALFQEKLADKAATWDGPDWQHNVFPYEGPWGEFSFADPDARDALNAFCDEHQIDVVVANPTLGLGVAGSGRPDETQQFMDWLVECGLKSSRAFWLLHHENKAGQISGDWGRHPDTKVQLQADGKQPRTKLIWEKTRWATLPSDGQPKACLLEWIVETKGYHVVELDSAGASDDELEQRVRDYLQEHPLATTNDVTGNVKGTNKRISELLKNGEFDCIDGPRGSKQWFIPNDRVETPDAVPTQ